MSSRPVYRTCAQVAPSGECLRGYKLQSSGKLKPDLLEALVKAEARRSGGEGQQFFVLDDEDSFQGQHPA